MDFDTTFSEPVFEAYQECMTAVFMKRSPLTCSVFSEVWGRYAWLGPALLPSLLGFCRDGRSDFLRAEGFGLLQQLLAKKPPALGLAEALKPQLKVLGQLLLSLLSAKFGKRERRAGVFKGCAAILEALPGLLPGKKLAKVLNVEALSEALKDGGSEESEGKFKGMQVLHRLNRALEALGGTANPSLGKAKEGKRKKSGEGEVKVESEVGGVEKEAEEGEGERVEKVDDGGGSKESKVGRKQHRKEGKSRLKASDTHEGQEDVVKPQEAEEKEDESAKRKKWKKQVT